jgi:hypothetical protein
VPAPSDETRVRWLLEELCTKLGTCRASREPTRFVSLLGQGVDAFTDAVLAAEELDPESSKHLRSQVQLLVGRHFAGWHR